MERHDRRDQTHDRGRLPGRGQEGAGQHVLGRDPGQGDQGRTDHGVRHDRRQDADECDERERSGNGGAELPPEEVEHQDGSRRPPQPDAVDRDERCRDGDHDGVDEQHDGSDGHLG